MGKGKSKINHYIHRYPKSSIFLILKPKISNSTELKKILKYKEIIKNLEKGLIKIKLKFPNVIS